MGGACVIALSCKKNIERRACVFVAGEPVQAKVCQSSSVFNWIGCKSHNYLGNAADVCVCNTPRCNAAPVTSSLSHVIVVVALITGVITARLM